MERRMAVFQMANLRLQYDIHLDGRKTCLIFYNFSVTLFAVLFIHIFLHKFIVFDS